MSLKSCEKQQEANLWKVTVEIDGDTFSKCLSAAFKKVQPRLQIPGFRKGKVTRHMAEAYFGKSFLYEDALDMCYSENVEAALKETELDIVGTDNPSVKEIGPEGGHGFADGTGMCMAGWTERAVRFAESLPAD